MRAAMSPSLDSTAAQRNVATLAGRRGALLVPGAATLGTDGATENTKDGDVVEVEIPGIGVLRNPVVRER